MKKIIVLLMAALMAGTSFAAPAAKSLAKRVTKKAAAEFVIIEDDVYAAGKEDGQLTRGLAAFLEVEPKVTHVTAAEAKNDTRFAGIEYDFLPVYLIKKTDAIRSKMAQHIERGFVKENNEFVILEHQTRQGVYVGKTAKPNVMEIFVMSQCPYGVMAESMVIQAKKDGAFPTDKEVRLHYIVNYDEKNGFNSLHGSGEWEEDVRQLLIAKYYPTKFWKYLEIRNKDYRSSRWDKAMEDAGINAKKIMKKFDTEGLELLKQEAKYADEYGVNASPTFLWEGKVQLDFGTASQIDGFGFLNPSQNRPGAAAAPAGQC